MVRCASPEPAASGGLQRRPLVNGGGVPVGAVGRPRQLGKPCGLFAWNWWVELQALDDQPRGDDPQEWRTSADRTPSARSSVSSVSSCSCAPAPARARPTPHPARRGDRGAGKLGPAARGARGPRWWGTATGYATRAARPTPTRGARPFRSAVAGRARAGRSRQRGILLPCHLGTETFSLAHLGAIMTGLDFSGLAGVGAGASNR